jgi:DNA-directed RNA polymerase subunit alpha
MNKYTLKFTKVSEDKNSGVFSFEPLPVGFGNTLGSSLRRVLLTSLKGAAVTSFNFPGVTHQFTSIDGVKEDVIEITLNLKDIRFKSHADGSFTGKISKKGAGVITAGDIEISSEIEVLNKDSVIATVTDKSKNFDMLLTVETGVGYSPVEKRENVVIGSVLVDSIFSPIKSVNYNVEETRVGRESGLDKLTIEVITDGSISASDAVKDSAAILRDFYSQFASVNESTNLDNLFNKATTSDSKSDNTLVEDLPLQTRTINALKKHGINSLQDLRNKSDEEINDIKNLGDKSIEEIKKLLGRL